MPSPPPYLIKIANERTVMRLLLILFVLTVTSTFSYTSSGYPISTITISNGTRRPVSWWAGYVPGFLSGWQDGTALWKPECDTDYSIYTQNTPMLFADNQKITVEDQESVPSTASVVIHIWSNDRPDLKSWVSISVPSVGPSSCDSWSNPASDVGLDGWHKNDGDDDNIHTTVIIQMQLKGMYVDRSSQTPVYVGYDEPQDVGNKNISLIPNVVLPLPVDGVYPGWRDIVPIKCYDVELKSTLMGKLNRWCAGLPHDPNIKDFMYGLSYNVNERKILSQLHLDLTGMPGEKSVAWWTNAKELSEICYLVMPGDIQFITGLYHDKASGRDVYVGYDDPKDVETQSIVIIPDVQLPVPVPPAYPKCGDITPILCSGLKSGYMITGGANRWESASNNLLLKKFSYYVTEDVDGNIYLIQGVCDFSGIPDSESLTWWKNAKVLIKKIKSKTNTSTIKNPSPII